MSEREDVGAVEWFAEDGYRSYVEVFRYEDEIVLFLSDNDFMEMGIPKDKVAELMSLLARAVPS